MNKKWFKEYLELYRTPLFDDEIYLKLIELKDFMEKVNMKGCKTMILGNGGSAAIASHVSVDFSKNAKIRVINFNEADLITCLANDYGYEKWMSKAVDIYGDKGDQVILISSSGNSKNVVEAAITAKKNQHRVITFTGFDKTNSLKSHGDLNFWVNSKAYNIVEMIHQIWLLSVCDAIIGNAEYPAS